MRGSAERVAGGALVLASALVLLARPPGRVFRAACPRPGEVSVRLGKTTAVRCGGGGAKVRGPARLLFGERLDLNCSDADSLEALPGIGPARAQDIVLERCRAVFSDPAGLLRVRGIGRKTLAGLEGWVEVGERSSGDEGCQKMCP